MVSIVVATYCSRPEHVRRALASALAQIYPQIEIIVSDDSPSDVLQSVVSEFQDSRLTYQRNIPALGPAMNHWSCFRAARGQYIAILNHDDLLEPEFLVRLVPPLQNDSSIAVAFCDHWIIDEDGTVLTEVTEEVSVRYLRTSLTPGNHRPFHQLLLRQAIPMAMGAVFRRSALPEILPPEAGPAYDLWLTYLLARTGMGAWYEPHRLSSWRSHASNQTSVASMGLLVGGAECWAAVSGDCAMSSISDMARKRAASAFVSCSRRALRKGLWKDAGRYAIRALRYRSALFTVRRKYPV